MSLLLLLLFQDSMLLFAQSDVESGHISPVDIETSYTRQWGTLGSALDHCSYVLYYPTADKDISRIAWYRIVFQFLRLVFFVILASTHSGLGLVLVSLGLAKTRQAGPGAVSLLLCPSSNATDKMCARYNVHFLSIFRHTPQYDTFD